MTEQINPTAKQGVSKELAEKIGDKTTDADRQDSENKNLPAIADPFSSFVEKHKQDFEMVIPSHIKPDRILRLAISAYRRVPDLMKCTLESVIGGVMESAALGLEVNTPMKQANLIPFRNNKTKKLEAELIIQYRGYIDLMYNHSKVLSVFGNVVFTKDHFVCRYGTHETLEHEESEEVDRGSIKGFYAYAKLRDEAYRFVYLTKAKVDNIRDTYSASYKSNKEASPWHTNYIEMGVKSAVRSLEKFVPKSAEISRAVESDSKVFTKQDILQMPPAEIVSD